MKKLLLAQLIIFTLLLLFSFILSPTEVSAAVCTPYPSCDFNINIDVRGYEPISGYLGLVDFTHRIDQRAPQLTTLIEGNCYPAITSLYQVYEWINDTRDGLYPRPSDLPGNFDFATLVGLSTQAGQAILVPDSGYDIGGGYNALILYATSNQITLQYTPYDGVGVPGYTIHLKNFNVDPALLDCYNQMNQAGRKELPAVLAGEKIGEASGGEVLVAIRDTGSFMDPRWKNDWWQRCAPTRGIEFTCKTISVSPPVPPPAPSPGPNPYPSLVCDPKCCSDTDSRPAECNICNFTYLKTPSCAESFTVHDNVSFYWWEGQKCSVVTPEEYWVKKPWGGTVTVNPSETTIPFVGKKGSENEKLYLADYFEGTNEYYKNYGKYWLDWVNYAGVLRKLTPMQYQDKLKENMIEERIASPGAPQEGKVHDYQLKYVGRVCWDIPFLADALLAFAERLNLPVIGQPIEAIAKRGHYCLFEGSLLDNFSVEVIENAIRAFNLVSPIDIALQRTGSADATLSSLKGHEPPDPSEENYVEKWNAWKESEWGRLWEVVPLVSREDTPGDISPYLGRKPEDTFEITNPEAQIEKVPHVARLYEASQEINKLMTPSQESTGISQEKTGPIIASAGENVLLAQAATNSIPCDCFVYKPSPDCSCMGRIKSDGKPDCIGEQNQGGHCSWHLRDYGGCICGYADCQGGPNCQCNNVPFCADANVPFSAPSCGLGEARPVNLCQKPAITDTNPNDDLCCSQININLAAVDSFNITDWYNQCSFDQTLPGCNSSKTEDVSRQIGINLLHPYLYEIWNQTGEGETAGIFNFFRPASVPEFSDIDAASQINYGYSGGSVEPSVGKFYFPYLGGIQLAKEWLIQTLTPWKE